MNDDFTELCIAVAQLAHSCQKLGLTSIKLQMNPRDFMSIKQHSLACGQDLHGVHSELHTHERKLATIPVIVQW